MNTTTACFAAPASKVALIALILLAGCATDPKTTSSGGSLPTDSTENSESAPKAGMSRGRMTVNGASYDSLGKLVRAVGETAGEGGLVLVAGLEEWPSPSISVERATYHNGISRLVAPSNLKVFDGEAYQFIYPPGYETLLDVTLGDTVAPRFQSLRATYAVGAGTDLFNALALLSETLGFTVLADNEIADAWCGELFLCDAPAPSILEALLRSARIVPGSIVVENSDSYIFIRSARNKAPLDTCVNRDTLSAEAAAMLTKQVNLQLPRNKPNLQFQNRAAPIKSVIDDMSRQLGVSVVVSPEMAAFPINPAVFSDMNLSDVLNLIVRQWPEADFGYRVTRDQVQFCMRVRG